MSNLVLKRAISTIATASLALVGVVGLSAPAQAAPAINLVPTTGTEYGMLEGDTFSLTASMNAEVPAGNAGKLRVKVENLSGGTFSSFAINGTTLDSTMASDSANNSIAFFGYAGGNNTSAAIADTDGTQDNVAATDGATAVMGLASQSSTFSATESISVMTSPFSFVIDADTVPTTPDAIAVTVFVDEDNDGSLDSGELASPTRTVTFYDNTDVSPVVSGSAFSGDTSTTLSLSYSGINHSQLNANQPGILVKDNNGDVISETGSGYDDGILHTGEGSWALNTAKTKFTVTLAPSSGANSTFGTSGIFSSFTLQALWNPTNNTSPASSNTVGSVVTLNVTERTSASSESAASIVPSANAVGGTGTTNVKRNSEWSAFVDVENSAGANLSGVSTSAAVTLSSGVVLSSSETITIDGTTYTDETALGAASWVKTTGADGRASLTVSTTGFAADDTVTITWTVQGDNSEAVTATMKTAEYSPAFFIGSEASNDGYDQTMLIGGTHEVKIAVADQFGVAPANGAYSVTVARAANVARTTSAAWSYVVPVVDGIATATISDNGAGAGSDTVTVTLVGADASSTTDSFVLSYANAAGNDITGLTLTDTQGSTDSAAAINATALPAWHAYLTGAVAAPSAAANYTEGSTTRAATPLSTLTLSGVATLASGSGNEGELVTLSAQGLTFKFTDGASSDIYARDSITVPTNSAGGFTVYVYSDGKGGETTITATADGISATTKVTFDTGVATDLAVSVPSVAADGRAIDVTATVTDAAGDAVEGISVSFKATGVGYLSSLSGTSDADGEVVVKLITQTGELGSATVTATATLDGVSTAVATTVTVTDDGTAASAEQKVNAGSFKGYVAVYAKGYAGDRLSFKAGNDWNVTESLASDYERVVEFTGAGYTISVRIYINRVLVDTIVVTTK